MTVFATGKPINLSIDIAEFNDRSNGLQSAPVLGLAGPMRTWASLEWAQDFLFRVSLILLAVYGFVVVIFRPSDRASLYFALACLGFLPLATTVGYDSLLMVAFPGSIIRRGSPSNICRPILSRRRSSSPMPMRFSRGKARDRSSP